jgi:GAF domain-containing protein
MHHIDIPSTADKEQKFKALLPQIESLVSGEPDLIANLSNIAAVLKEGCGYFWVGFYLIRGDELVLGPFQGPVACTRIARGKGVCGDCWEQGKVIVVPDVEKYPGHIACNAASKSEIVLPVVKNGEVTMIFDVDSEVLDDFDQVDQWFLREVAEIVSKL